MSGQEKSQSKQSNVQGRRNTVSDLIRRMRGLSPLPDGYVEFKEIADRARSAWFGKETQPPRTKMECSLMLEDSQGLAGRPFGSAQIDDWLSPERFERINNPILKANYDEALARWHLIAVQEKSAADWLRRKEILTDLPDGQMIVDLTKFEDIERIAVAKHSKMAAEPTAEEASAPPQLTTEGEARALEKRNPSASRIRDTMDEEYQMARQNGKKPPNVKEIAELVKARLTKEGFAISKNEIQRIAAEQRFCSYRLKPGQRHRG